MSAALAIVIPVRDDRDDLLRLLGDLRRADCVSEIVVVDDASADALSTEVLTDALGGWDGEVWLHRSERPAGAGVARNLGLRQVTTSHTLFLDADDRPTGELAPLWRSVARRSFDFCLFKHADARAAPHWGQPSWDEALWRRAGHAVGALRPVTPDAALLLSRTANYPWNKIYRTGFLREHRIRCGTTQVHNDMRLHWHSFAKATDILSSDRIAVYHETGDDRLTSRAGRDRFDVFDAIKDVAALLGPDSPLTPPFRTFAWGLLDWARSVIDPALKGEFDERHDLLLLQFGWEAETDSKGAP